MPIRGGDDHSTWLTLLKSLSGATIMALLKEIVEPSEQTWLQKIANALIVGFLTVGLWVLLLRFLEISELEIVAFSGFVAYLGKEGIVNIARYFIDRGLKRNDGSRT